jgi:hypothetical protein
MKYKYDNKGKINGAKTDKYTIKVLRDCIRVKGYEEWISVCYMDRNEDRVHCIDWVLGLIERGVLHPLKVQV